VKYHKGRDKATKITNTKIPTDPYKTAIFPVGIPFWIGLLRPKLFCQRKLPIGFHTIGDVMPLTASAHVVACIPTPYKSLKITTVGIFPYEWQH